MGATPVGLPMLMDRAYEGSDTRALVAELGFEPVVPPTSQDERLASEGVDVRQMLHSWEARGGPRRAFQLRVRQKLFVKPRSTVVGARPTAPRLFSRASIQLGATAELVSATGTVIMIRALMPNLHGNSNASRTAAGLRRMGMSRCQPRRCM